MKRYRKYWLEDDRRGELEQITFGERVQSYVAADEYRGQPVASVLTYIDARGKDRASADEFIELYAMQWPRGAFTGKHLPGIEKIVFHHYSGSKDAARRRMPGVEEIMLRTLDSPLHILVVIVAPPNAPYRP